MKITDYPEIDSLEMTDSFIVETGGGTKQIKVPNMQIPNGLSDDAAIVHRNVFRGKNLGDAYTDEQKTMVRNGTFDDLFVGDYWEIDGHKWRIADIDYYYPLTETHHLLILPDNVLYKSRVSDAATAQSTIPNGYSGSYLFKTGLNTAKSIINTAFGSQNQMAWYDYLVNSVSNSGDTQGMGITDELVNNITVNILNERMVFGCFVFANTRHTGIAVSNTGSKMSYELALFRLNPRCRESSDSYWLSDILNAYRLSVMDKYGRIAHTTVETEVGIRPYFCLKG